MRSCIIYLIEFELIFKQETTTYKQNSCSVPLGLLHRHLFWFVLYFGPKK